MPDSPAERHPIDELAEEFAERYRRGDRPPLSDYIRRYPELADEIREVFPALVMMEQLKPVAGDGSDETGDGRPERIGDYRVLREAGRGGMGVVYEAEELSLGRRVALKVLSRAGLNDPTYLERFRREAKAAARLHHTNIVPVFGVGECAGVHYYAMQFIHGEGLDRVLDDLRRLRKQPGVSPSFSGHGAPPSVAHSLINGQFISGEPAEISRTDCQSVPRDHTAPPSTATLSGGTSGGEYYRSMARVGLQVAEALAYAHKQGILHRDIKPSNLILDLQGTVWITDFGLAKAEGAGDLTHTGDIVGTVRYMAPERLEGASLPQGDVYALGMTLYELLTLRPAFADTNQARLIQRIGHEEPPLPRKFDAHIPRDLETIVLKACAAEPARRYVSAENMAEDFRRFLSDRPIRARRNSAAERLWRWCRRNPAVAGLTGVVAALLIAGAIGSTLAALSLHTHKQQALDKLWRAKLDEARAAVLSRQTGQRFTSLERIREALAIARQQGLTEEDRLQFRNAAIAALALPDVEVIDKWNDFPAGASEVSFDKTLDKYVRADRDGKVIVCRLSDGRELLTLPGRGRPVSVRLSPDGRHAAVCTGSWESSGPMQVWQLDLPQPRCIHEDAALNAHFTDFDADGQKLIYESSQHLNVLDLATAQPRSLPLPGTRLGGAVKCRPHREQVAVCRSLNGESRVEIRDLATGKIDSELHRTEISSLAWHPDGRRLAVAFGGLKPGICLWEPEGRQEPAVLEGHKNSGIVVLFNHAGDRLLSTDWNGMVRVWDVAARLQVQSVTGVNMSSAAFSNDDRYLAGTHGEGRRLQVFRFAPGRELRTLVRRPIRGAASKPVFSADGQLLVVPLLDPPFAQFTSVAIFAWPGGRELGRLAVPNTFPLGFDPAGALWTSSVGGDVIRWPRATGPSPGTIRFGPPEPMVSVPQGEGRALSPDGRTVVIANGYEGSLILQRGPPERLAPTGAQEDVRYGAISPDGSWLASGSHHHGSAKVWDAVTGRLVKSFDVGRPCDVGFSPDGHWLVTGGDGTRLWKVPASSGLPSRTVWEEGPPLLADGDSHGWAFSPESKLLALGGHGRIRLVRPDTGAEVARLSFPEPTKFEPMAFSPDGGELLIQGEDTQAIHVWDVRLVRGQLAEMGLDWDDPISAPPSAVNSAAVNAVEFDGATFVSDSRTAREYRRALTVLALVANPFDPRAHLHLGQLSEDQSPEIAFAHYTAALAFQPDQPLAYELRAGVARRLGRWPQVVADATEALRRQPQRPRLVLARAQALQHLGRHADAVADFTAALAAYPRSMEVYKLRAKSYGALGETGKAQLDERKALAVAPEDPFHLNERAWRMVAGPLAERDAPAALSLALRAVHLAPSDSLYVNTLGVAQYRNGLYQEALVTLERSLALGNGRWDAFDLFFLAMCHQELGAASRAQDCFDRAMRWWREQKTADARRDEELGSFRAEAQACLRANKSGANK